MADSGGADDVLPPCENFDPELVNQSYYHGWLPRDDLPYLLQRDGDFLVRITEADSLGTRLEMVLSVLHDPEGRYTHRKKGPVDEKDIVHIIIQSVQNKYYMDDSKLYNTVNNLIDHFTRHTMLVRDLKVRIRRAVCLGSWELRAQDIRLGESIGKSGCIEVRKGSFERDGKFTEVSVTTVRGRSQYAKQTIVEMMRQCRMLRDLHHPCVVEFYGVCLLTHPCCFLMEYVSEGPLNEYLKKGQGKLKRDELLLMVMSAGWGIEFIHSYGIIHRDLAARNCFYDKQLVKISGFGLARKASNYTMKTLRKLSVHWMAPETVEEFLYSQKSDVYSFGILTYEIFSQKEPYEGYSNQEAKAFILEGRMNDFPPNTPRKLANFVNSKLWNNDPDDRPTMEQVTHWLAKYTGTKLQIGTLGVSETIVHQNVSAPVMKDVDYKTQEDNTPPEKLLVLEDKLLETPDSATALTHLLTQTGRPSREMEAQKTEAMGPLSHLKPPGAVSGVRVASVPFATPEIKRTTHPLNTPPLSGTMTQKIPCQTASVAEYENIGGLEQPKPISQHTAHLPKTLPASVQMTAKIPCQTDAGAEYENISALQRPKPISTHTSQVPKTASVPTQLIFPKPALPLKQQLSPVPAPGTAMKPMTAKSVLPKQLPQTTPVPGPGPQMHPMTAQLSPKTSPIPIPGTPTDLVTAQLPPKTSPILFPGAATHPITAQVPKTAAIPAQGMPTHPITAQLPRRTSPIPTPGTPTHPITAQLPKTAPIPVSGLPTHPVTAQLPPKTSPIPTPGTPTHPITLQLPRTPPMSVPGLSTHPITAQVPKTATIPPPKSPSQPIIAQPSPRTPPIPTPGTPTHHVTTQLPPARTPPLPIPGVPTHPTTAQLPPKTSPIPQPGIPTHPITTQPAPKTLPIPTPGAPTHPIPPQVPRTAPILAPGAPTHPITGQVPKTTSMPAPVPPTHLITAQLQKTAAIPAPGLPTHSAQQFPQQSPKTPPIPAQELPAKPVSTHMLQQLPSTSPIPSHKTPTKPITLQPFQQTLPKFPPIPVHGTPTRPTTMQQPLPGHGLSAKPVFVQTFQQPFPQASPIPTSVAAKPPFAVAANETSQGLASSARQF